MRLNLDCIIGIASRSSESKGKRNDIVIIIKRSLNVCHSKLTNSQLPKLPVSPYLKHSTLAFLSHLHLPNFVKP